MIRIVLGLFALVCAVTAAAQAPSVVLVLAEHAAVDGPDIRLADVAAIRTADDALRTRLSKLALAPSPVVGAPRMLRSDAIAQRLTSVETGLEVEMRGAIRVRVERRSIDYPASRQIERARAHLLQYLRAHYPTLVHVDVAAAHEAADLHVPVGVLDVQPREIRGSGLSKRVCVWLDVRVDGKVYRSVPVWLSVTARAPVLVARRAIKPREKLTPSDVVQEERDVADLGSPALAALADVVGQRARTFLPAGAVVQAKDVEPSPAVWADTTVDVRVTSGAIVIETQAVAEEDGRVGDTVHVRNPTTASIFSARVVGDERVAITER